MREFTLTSEGLVVKVINFGAIVTSIRAKDKNGQFRETVLGFDSIEEYLTSNRSFFGAVCGRFANRIAHGKFTLDEVEYSLVTNNAPGGLPCHLHGGTKGFDKKLFAAKTLPNGVELSCDSPDGEEGYPGTLRTTVTYTVSGGELRIDLLATTDKATVLNLTNHTYFNLTGQISSILEHEIRIESDRLIEVNAGCIPTGELVALAGTPFDFRQFRKIGEQIDAPHEQIQFGLGYDHGFEVRDYNLADVRLAASVREPEHGILLEVLTTEPSVHFYSGNYLSDQLPPRNGQSYFKRSGFCLETQHYPDSPNKPQFPTTVLRPGQQFKSRTVFRYSLSQ